MAHSSLCRPTQAGPATSALAVTPSDGTDLAIPDGTRALWVGVTGAVKVDMIDGQAVTFTAMNVGWHPLCVTRVYSTGTTASSIVAVW